MKAVFIVILALLAISEARLLPARRRGLLQSPAAANSKPDSPQSLAQALLAKKAASAPGFVDWEKRVKDALAAAAAGGPPAEPAAAKLYVVIPKPAAPKAPAAPAAPAAKAGDAGKAESGEAKDAESADAKDAGGDGEGEGDKADDGKPEFVDAMTASGLGGDE